MKTNCKSGSFFHDFVANDWYSQVFGGERHLFDLLVAAGTPIVRIIETLYSEGIGMTGYIGIRTVERA